LLLATGAQTTPPSFTRKNRVIGETRSQAVKDERLANTSRDYATLVEAVPSTSEWPVAAQIIDCINSNLEIVLPNKCQKMSGL